MKENELRRGAAQRRFGRRKRRPLLRATDFFRFTSRRGWVGADALYSAIFGVTIEI
jgi:hypothetical protein